MCSFVYDGERVCVRACVRVCACLRKCRLENRRTCVGTGCVSVCVC